MIRVMVADDEPKIRRGLSALVNRTPGFEVVAEAENGLKAWEAFEQSRPDLLLVDIRMPLMDGLEFLRRLEASGHEALAVIVTGHDEFRYAQEAIKLRAFDFVLKPVKPASFQAMLEKVAAEVESRAQRDSALQWAHQEIERNRELFGELALREWFLGALSQPEFDSRRQLLDLELPAVPGLVLARVQPRLAVPGERAERSERLLAMALRRLAQELFEPFPPTLVFEDLKGTLGVVCSAAGQDWVDACGTLVQRLQQRFGAVAVVVQKVVTDSPAGLLETYEELSEQLAQKSGLLPMVVLAESYLEKTYMDPRLSLERAAADLGLSPGYLSRLLKQQTGHSFTEYLTRFRIGKAAVLLADPTLKVQTVAELTGYASQHYFTRSFKKVLGAPPQAFRRGAP